MQAQLLIALEVGRANVDRVATSAATTLAQKLVKVFFRLGQRCLELGAIGLQFRTNLGDLLFGPGIFPGENRKRFLLRARSLGSHR